MTGDTEVVFKPQLGKFSILLKKDSIQLSDPSVQSIVS